MIKLKSCLTCTIVSLLMVVLLSGLAHGVHPWAEEPGDHRDGGPRNSIDGKAGKKEQAEVTSDMFLSPSGSSWKGYFSIIVYDASKVLEDIVYGPEADAQNTVTDARSN